MVNRYLRLYDLFLTKLAFNLKAEAAHTYLSYLWWILEPALLVFTFYLVFAVFFANSADNFVIFLLCGNIPFFWFSKTVGNATNSIVHSKSLISLVAISKVIFPLLVVFQDLVKQVVVFLFVFSFFVIFGVTPTIEWVFLPLVILTQLLLTIACALFVAAVTPFLPDFRYLVDTGLLMLMFASGVFYDYQMVILPEHRSLFLTNPIANLIANYREIIMYNRIPDLSALFTIALLSLVAIGILMLYYRKTDSLYSKLVIQ